MIATGAKLVVIFLTVMSAVTAVAGAAAWAQTWDGGPAVRPDRQTDRVGDRGVPGICGTPWASDPTAWGPVYMTLLPPLQWELGVMWRGPALPWKVEVDIDGDGRTDIIYFDRDRDGKWDAAWLLNQPEGVYLWDDKNRDGKMQRDEMYLLDLSQVC